MYIAVVNYINSKSLFLSLLFFQLRNCDHYNRYMGMNFSKYCFRNNSAPIAKILSTCSPGTTNKNFSTALEQQTKKFATALEQQTKALQLSAKIISLLSLSQIKLKRGYISLYSSTHTWHNITLLHCKVQAAAFF